MQTTDGSSSSARPLIISTGSSPTRTTTSCTNASSPAVSATRRRSRSTSLWSEVTATVTTCASNSAASARAVGKAAAENFDPSRGTNTCWKLNGAGASRDSTVSSMYHRKGPITPTRDAMPSTEGYYRTTPRVATSGVSVIETLVDSLGDQINPWGYLLLFLLCLLEASAFVGLFVPGESALLIAGVMAEQGKLSLGACMVWAVAGAIVGDSIGYEIGRHFGPQLRDTWFGQRVGEQRWERAHDFVRRNGGRSIFFGRFIGVLRALVPAIAGDARMPYGQFFVWNVAGALIAAPAVILLGYLAGSSYHVVE